MILIRPPLSVADIAFRLFNNLDATKKAKFNLADIPTGTTVTLQVKGVDGKIVVGEYVAELKSYVLEE